MLVIVKQGILSRLLKTKASGILVVTKNLILSLTNPVQHFRLSCIISKVPNSLKIKYLPDKAFQDILHNEMRLGHNQQQNDMRVAKLEWKIDQGLWKWILLLI